MHSGDDDTFKATQLWKEAITGFRNTMPRKRRRVKMHFYESCFTGPEAVQWLLQHLQTTELFGATVSKQQVERLLQKFLTSNVIEEVKGQLHDFKQDNCYLYRFVTQPGPFNFVEDENSTPKGKGVAMSVTPGSSLGKRRKMSTDSYNGTWFSNEHASTSFDEESSSTLATPIRGALDTEKVTVYDVLMESPAKKCRMEVTGDSGFVAGYKQGGVGGDEDDVLVAKVWKELTLNRLLHLIELPSLDKVLTHDKVDGRHIAFNVSSLARIVGGACSSAAHSCVAAVSASDSATGGYARLTRPLQTSLLPPASHAMRRRSSRRSLHTPLTSHQHRKGQSPHREVDGDYPQWVLLSMKCLSKWPESCNEDLVGGIPMYSGFELDVFKTLVQFFHSEREPLVTSALYDLYMAVLKLIRSGHAHSIEAMQLCCLLLTQQSRLKLHHVLCFVNEASTNPKLRLSKDQPNLSVLLEQFCPVVMRRSSRRGHHVESSGMRDDLCTLLTFMAEHCHSIMKVPDDLRMEVQERLKQLKEGKGSPVEVKKVFCQQVSAAQYEEQRKCHAHHHHMSALLEGILANSNMREKEKREKLKMFQEQYPTVFAEMTLQKRHPLLDLPANGKRATSQRAKSARRSRTKMFSSRTSEKLPIV